MHRWLAAPLLIAGFVALSSESDSSRAFAQDDNKPVEENFSTADGVRLKGLFHKAPKPAPGNPVVMLLYEPGIGHSMDKPGDWGGLTKTLNDKGFHVFRFDWRGHGRSKDITDPNEFWNNPITGPWNKRHVKGWNKKPIKNDIDVKTDIGQTLRLYLPVFVNDLAAARVHLDGKNDQNDLSTSSIYLIGAEDAAGLGLMWMSAEWIRPAKHPLLGAGLVYKVVPTNGIIVDPEAGNDIAGAVWLTGSRPPSFLQRNVSSWLQIAPKLRDNNPMLMLYGEKDLAGKAQASIFYDQVLVAKGNKALGVKALEQTFINEVKGTNLKGAALLGNNAKLGTEDTIMKYLEARQKDRAAIVRRTREYPAPYYINIGYFGLTRQ
jgi:pimeloyl-ACP methyl ester carboxylesterase